MKAVLLAGGRGSRLMPLTENKPKPLVELLGKPTICYLFELIEKTNINEVYITLGYKGEQIRDYLGNSYGNLSLKYSYENKPLGTSGGVKVLANKLHEDFIVLSGDIYTDVDLNSIIDFHYKKRGIATLLSCRVDNPSSFGVIVKDQSSRIIYCEEKPSKSSSNLINGGIYVFSREVLSFIPDGFSDFSKDIFPSLSPIYCYDPPCSWSDIGTLSAYYNVNLMLASRYEEGQIKERVLQKAT